MLLHPHVHMLVTAGGLSPDGSWRFQTFPLLVPVEALGNLPCQILCGIEKGRTTRRLAFPLWKKKWVVHAQHAGRGEKVLDYLGRYVFRIAIANSRIESIDNGHVHFRYRDNQSQQARRVTLPACEFIGRFLQHVLPRGCVKVRYYGIWSPSRRPQLERARSLLSANPPAAYPPVHLPLTETPAPTPGPHPSALSSRRFDSCPDAARPTESFSAKLDHRSPFLRPLSPHWTRTHSCALNDIMLRFNSYSCRIFSITSTIPT